MTFYGQDGKKRDISDIFSPLSNRGGNEENNKQQLINNKQ